MLQRCRAVSSRYVLMDIS